MCWNTGINSTFVFFYSRIFKLIFVLIFVFSELPLKDAQHVNEDGTLYYHAAHICINSFTVDFVKVISLFRNC